MFAGMECLRSTDILEMSVILPFTHSRFGRQMDLSKKMKVIKTIKNNKKSTKEFKRCKQNDLS